MVILALSILQVAEASSGTFAREHVSNSWRKIATGLWRWLESSRWNSSDGVDLTMLTLYLHS
jgi:hypothetical protein